MYNQQQKFNAHTAVFLGLCLLLTYNAVRQGHGLTLPGFVMFGIFMSAVYSNRLYVKNQYRPRPSRRHRRGKTRNLWQRKQGPDHV